ncbi:MAG TPA: hypothetical protein VNZ64_24190 [Candidatus Acidoferrum sp.]|nr:hypothetical protein [Candidatus Acidoferrum sp.]
MVARHSRQIAPRGEKIGMALAWNTNAPGIGLSFSRIYMENRFDDATSSRGNVMQKSTAKSRFVVEQDKKFLLNAPEVSLFSAALVIINQVRGLEQAFKLGTIAKGAFTKKANALLEHLTETVAATERFDIVLPVMDYGRLSPFFWRWFNWWDDYFKELTPKQVEEIERLRREHSSTLEDYRPKGHWLVYRQTPAPIPVITSSRTRRSQARL